MCMKTRMMPKLSFQRRTAKNTRLKVPRKKLDLDTFINQGLATILLAQSRSGLWTENQSSILENRVLQTPWDFSYLIQVGISQIMHWIPKLHLLNLESIQTLLNFQYFFWENDSILGDPEESRMSKSVYRLLKGNRPLSREVSVNKIYQLDILLISWRFG